MREKDEKKKEDIRRKKQRKGETNVERYAEQREYTIHRKAQMIEK